MATVTEIAQRVGVSPQTVSRVLNGDFKGTYPKVVKRAQRIRQVAEEMGYRSNTAAQAVRSGRFAALGLLLSTTRHFSHLPGGLLQGLQEATEASDEHLTIGRVPDAKLADEGHVPKILRRWAVDGLLINYQYHLPAGMNEQIRRHRVPAVWINADLPHDCVRLDDLDAGRRLTEHLLAQGHTRIAYVDFSHGRVELPAEHYSATHRAAGYEQAMCDAGLPPRIIRPEHTLEPPHSFEHARGLLQRDDRPAAVITYSSNYAHMFAVAAMLEGLTCGKDLELATFAEAPVFPHFGYSPITMVEPGVKLGRAAVAMLHEKINQPAAALPARKLPFELTRFQPGLVTVPPLV
ncbi:MAG: LacI family DNA-binding transcriptional regulator [Phycisphaeraceae bacterium]